jgi:hypothetical protein
MSVVENSMMFKTLRNGVIAAALSLGAMAGAAEAAPIAPGSMQQPFETQIEKAQVVVVHHPRRRPVVVHHHRHRRQVCWWSHGRRICRWR